jgi:Serine incorporator (Serinc).
MTYVINLSVLLWSHVNSDFQFYSYHIKYSKYFEIDIANAHNVNISCCFQVPFCSGNDKIATHLNLTVNCEYAVGYLAVYRICFAICAFFFLMAMAMIGVKSSKDPRAGIQNGLVHIF